MHGSLSTMHKTTFSGLEIQSAGCSKNPKGIGKPLHSHTGWEIVYYLQGNPQCRLGDTVVDTNPGMVLVIPPGLPHGEITQQPWSCYYLLLEFATFAPGLLQLHDDGESLVNHVLAALIREWTSEREYRLSMLSLLLSELDILLRRLNPSIAPSSAELAVRQLERLLEKRFTESVTISALCTELGVSDSYMRTLFARLRGQSPMQRLQQLRVRHALGAIQSSNQSLETIAEICGYASASHLSRHIKKATGRSPGEFRATTVISKPGLDRLQDRFGEEGHSGH
jgi:AraC-like DNA-binding protein